MTNDEGLPSWADKIILGEPFYDTCFERHVPKVITGRVLAEGGLPNELPNLGSTIIEDYLVKKLRCGKFTEEQIVKDFVTEGGVQIISDFINEVRRREKEVDWDAVSGKDRLDVVSVHVVAHMKSLGMSEQQCEEIRRRELAVVGGMGSSYSGKDSVVVNRGQSVRKALDYIKLHPLTSLQEAVEAFVIGGVGHELGHDINQTGKYIADRMPFLWLEKSEDFEKRSERFAEYWSEVALADNTEEIDITRRDWQIQTAKINMMWDALEENNKQGVKVDMIKVLVLLGEELKKYGDDVYDYYDSRKSLLSDIPPENYANPYTREEVAKGIKVVN